VTSDLGREKKKITVGKSPVVAAYPDTDFKGWMIRAITMTWAGWNYGAVEGE